MMDIEESTRRYEAWLQRLIPVVTADLAFKHARMRESGFSFFRATFYRWCQLWTIHCPKLTKLPNVLSVGDLHVENFGTWRDNEGRLAWGVNDFDEAIPLPFTHDLTRLAVSAFLAAEEQPASLDQAEIVRLLLEGYQACIEQGGEAFVLAEKHGFMLHQFERTYRQAHDYWPRLKERLMDPPEEIPDTALKVLRKSLPKDAVLTYHVVKKPKGLGSLGRRRFIALSHWNGGWIAREIKDTVPSAFTWVNNVPPEEGNRWLFHTAESAIRAQDPFYEVRRNWLVRRLSPDCTRIELADSDKLDQLLRAMGYEAANIHLGSPQGRKAIRTAWKKLPDDWLISAATTLHSEVLKDWHAYCGAPPALEMIE